MELVWLIVQALVLCAALLAVTCGLMFAPWYVLLAALGIVLFGIQKLMAALKENPSEPVPSGSQKNSTIAQPPSPTEVVQPAAIEQLLPTSHSTHLIYRGIDYILSQDGKEDSV